MGVATTGYDVAGGGSLPRLADWQVRAMREDGDEVIALTEDRREARRGPLRRRPVDVRHISDRRERRPVVLLDGGA